MRHALPLALALTAIATVTVPATAAAADISRDARTLANRSLIIDTHIDVPYRLENRYENVAEATPGGDFDYPRALAGGLDVAFMSIYIPADKQDGDEARTLADRLIDGVEKLAEESPRKFALVHSSKEAERIPGSKRIGLALGMENGAPIRNLDDLRHFQQRGIRYITLTHSKANHISDSSYDLERPWRGLSPFGKELVGEMNRLGILVDVSHVSDEAFWDALEASDVPLIATHSSARRYTPGFERNMSDDMIRAMAEKGGVIQINFGSSFVTERANAWQTLFSSHRSEWRAAQGEDVDSKMMSAFAAGYRAANPYPFSTLDEVLDHFDHVVSIAGIDHVGVGSDYDGVGDSLPHGLKTVEDFPRLVQGLLDRGYSRSDIRKVLGENTLRVWRAAEAFAAKNGN